MRDALLVGRMRGKPGRIECVKLIGILKRIAAGRSACRNA